MMKTLKSFNLFGWWVLMSGKWKIIIPVAILFAAGCAMAKPTTTYPFNCRSKMDNPQLSGEREGKRLRDIETRDQVHLLYAFTLCFKRAKNTSGNMILIFPDQCYAYIIPHGRIIKSHFLILYFNLRTFSDFLPRGVLH